METKKAAYCRRCDVAFTYMNKDVELSVTASGCHVPFVKCPLCGYNVPAKRFNNKKENFSMKKLFVSVPMKNRPETAITASIAKMKNIAEAYAGEKFELIDRAHDITVTNAAHIDVMYLGRSIQKMADADAYIGINDAGAQGFDDCFIENQVAYAYKIPRYWVNLKDIAPDIDY